MEEPGFDVLLTEVGSGRLDVIRVVRSVTGKSFWHSKLLLDTVPAVVVKGIWFAAAGDAARSLEAVGARAVLLCGWCERTLAPGNGVVRPEPCASPYWPASSCPASHPEQ